MIPVNLNPAFEFLRRHKTISDETEALVMKKVKGKISNNELLTVFEDGLSGKYGKLYQADPQTLVGWVEQYLKVKNSPKNYLSAGLLPITIPAWENIDWFRETNKCFKAFCDGVGEEYFHHAVYDRLMVDGKIPLNEYMKVFKEGEPETLDKRIADAKRKILRRFFTNFQKTGFTFIYFIKE